MLGIVIKLVAIVLAAFFGTLLWLKVQRIVTVNWKELESQSRNSLYNIVFSCFLPSGHLIAAEMQIGAPHNPEFAIGAVMPDGTYFLNEQVVSALHISPCAWSLTMDAILPLCNSDKDSVASHHSE